MKKFRIFSKNLLTITRYYGIIELKKNKTKQTTKPKGKEEKTMTVRELRQMLTEVENQEMTVKELRAILFEQEEQDKELEASDLLTMTYGK